MDIDQVERLGISRVEQYQENLRRLDRELVQHAASGRFRAAGRVFTQMLRLQADNALLPDREGYEVILNQLDNIPSKVLGVR